MKVLYTASGSAVLVDDDVYEWARKIKWHNGGPKKEYARAYMGKRTHNGEGKSQFLHRLIAGAGKGQVTDHKNGNTFDDRRQNLKLATCSQNRMNSKPTGPSGFKGVGLDKRRGTFTGCTYYRGRHLHFCSSKSPQICGLYYDRAARFVYREFARPNFNRPVSILDLRAFFIEHWPEDEIAGILFVTKHDRQIKWRRFRSLFRHEQDRFKIMNHSRDLLLLRTAENNFYRNIWLPGILAFELKGERYYVADNATVPRCNSKQRRGCRLSEM